MRKYNKRIIKKNIKLNNLRIIKKKNKLILNILIKDILEKIFKKMVIIVKTIV